VGLAQVVTALLQFPVWLARLIGRAVGITPDLLVGFDDPVNTADEPDAVFLHLPVSIQRGRWWGATKPIEHCGVRIRVRTQGWADRESPGVWFDDSARHYCVTHRTLFEGYARFDIPLLVQHIRESYWHPDAKPGAYIADFPFMFPDRMGGVRLLPAVYQIGVDLIAGPRILASSEWVVIVTAAPSLAIERAFTDVKNISDSKRLWFRPVAQPVC
jgi:hypothetical protein